MSAGDDRVQGSRVPSLHVVPIITWHDTSGPGRALNLQSCGMYWSVIFKRTSPSCGCLATADVHIGACTCEGLPSSQDANENLCERKMSLSNSMDKNIPLKKVNELIHKKRNVE